MSLATMMSTIGWLGFLASLVALATATPSYDLTQDSSCPGSVAEGTRCYMNLTTTIPSNEQTNLKLEIFLPSNQTYVFQLCKPSVTMVGSSLISTNGVNLLKVEPQMEAQLGTYLFTRATYDFGNVSSLGTNNQLIISFCALRIRAAAAASNTIYYVVAGRDDDVLNEIWIGRVGYNISTQYNISGITPPTLTASPATIDVGGYAKVQLTIPISSHSANLVINAFGNDSNIGLLAPISISINQASQAGFGCLWSNKDYINGWVVTPATMTTNTMMSMNLGPVTKDGTGSIVVDIVYHALNTAIIGNSASVTVQVVPSVGLAVNQSVTLTFTNKTVYALTSVPTASFSIINPQPVYPVGSVISISVTLQVPANTSYNYQLQAVNGINMSDSRVQMCGADVLTAGLNFGFGAWNYAKPVTASSNHNTIFDKLTWNLGTITNFGSFSSIINAGADSITMRVYAKIANHSLNVAGQNVSIALAIFNDDNGFWLGQFWVPVDSNFSLVQNDTDAASPAFTFSYPSGNPYAYVNQAKEMLIDITTVSGVSYSMMDSSIYTPSANGHPIVSVCSVEVIKAGKNLPCVNLTAANLASSLVYRSNTSALADEAAAPVGSVCNSGAIMGPTENHLKVRFVVRLENHENVTASPNNTEYRIGAGTIFSDKRLWAADLSLYAFTGMPTNNAGPPNMTVDPTSITASSNGPFSIKLLIKAPPSSMLNYTLTSVLSGGSARVCSMRIVQLGRNVPCVSKILTINNVSAQSSQISQAYGTWSSAGVTPIKTAAVFDDDTVMVEVFGQVSAGTSSLTLTNTLNNLPTVPQQISGIAVANASLNIVPNVTVGLNPLPNGSVPTVLLPGQSFAVKAVLTYVPGSCPSVNVSFSALSANMIFSSAVASRAGNNLPCFNPSSVTFTTSIMLGNSIVTANIGYLCDHSNSDLPNPLDDQLEIIAYGSVPMTAAVTPFFITVSAAAAGTTVSASVTTPSVLASAPEVDQLTSAGVDAYLDNTTDDLSAVHIGLKFTLTFRLHVPPFAIGKALIEAISPIMNSSSVFHISNAYVSSWGRNIVRKYEPVFNFTYNSTMSDGNNDRAFIDLGTVMHQGFPVPNANSSDDEIAVTFEFVLTDHLMTFNQSQFWVTAGAVLGSSVIVIQRKIVVFRTGLEVAIPKLTVTANTTSVAGFDMIRLTAILGHDNGSACDLLNATLQIYLSSLLTYQSNSAINGSTAPGDSAGFANGMFTMQIGKLRVASTVSIQIILLVNVTTQQIQRIVVPFQMISTVRVVGGSYSELPTNMSSLTFTYLSCNQTLTVAPCQVSSLYGNTIAANALTAGGLPIGNERQQVTFYFGNRVSLTGIDIRCTLSTSVIAVNVVAATSEDGYNWLTLPAPLSVVNSHANPASPMTGRFFRFGPFTFNSIILGATNLTFAFYGCPVTTDVVGTPCIPPQMQPIVTALDRCAMVIPDGTVFACDYASKLNSFACWKYTVSNVWTRLKGISNIISYNSAPEEQLLMALADDRQHVVGSIDMGTTWFSIDANVELARTGSVNVTSCTPYNLDYQYAATPIAGTPWSVSGVGLINSGVCKFQWKP